MGRKANQSTLPKVNEELKGFSVGINPFGEITSSYDINKLNIFLDTRKIQYKHTLLSYTHNILLSSF
jgi:hypothetical protein